MPRHCYHREGVLINTQALSRNYDMPEFQGKRIAPIELNTSASAWLNNGLIKIKTIFFVKTLQPGNDCIQDAEGQHFIIPFVILASIKRIIMWKESENALQATFIFRDFSAAFAFMTEVAFQAEKMNHHPNWSNVWNTVKIQLNTHDAGNVVTEKDRELAAAIDRIYQKYQG